MPEMRPEPVGTPAWRVRLLAPLQALRRICRGSVAWFLVQGLSVILATLLVALTDMLIGTWDGWTPFLRRMAFFWPCFFFVEWLVRKWRGWFRA